MRGMPFNHQGKGVIAAAGAVIAEVEPKISWNISSKKRKAGADPKSVLDHRKSPSPPTSASTVSSPSCGGGGSTDTASVAAVSDNPLQKSAPSHDTTEEGGASSCGRRKEEWMSELQTIPQEIGLMGGEKCGLGVEDWETMLSETSAMAAAASPGQDHSFLRWIIGDVEDSSSTGFKQHQQQMLSHGPFSVPEDLETTGRIAGGFGLNDPGFGFESMGGIGGMGALPVAASTSVAPGGGFPIMSTATTANCNDGNKSIPNLTSSSMPNIKNPFFGSNPNSIFPLPPVNSFSLPPSMFFEEPMEEKPLLFSPNHLLTQHQTQASQNPSFFLPLNLYAQQGHQQQSLLLPPQPKRHHSMADPSCQIGPKVPFPSTGQDLFPRRHQPLPSQQQQSFGSYLNAQQRIMKPKLAGDESCTVAAAAAPHHQQQQQALVDHLFNAAELVEAGNSVNARGILARLNHQLSPHGKPFIRSAFYFKEALDAIVNNPVMPPSSPSSQPKPTTTPLDVVQKLNAYKNFSEISPVIQFTNFTCIQVLLEELTGCDRIHIIDFDIGVGGQWSSFMQELSQRRCSTAGTSPSLKITAFVTPTSLHTLELVLTKENLSHFANDLNIPFEFNVLNLESFDPAAIRNTSNGYTEWIGVNIPVGMPFTSTSAILHLVKQLSPKIVVSVDHDCDRSDLSFSQHVLNAFHTYTVLLESVDAAGTNLDVANKIERYLLQPRIENVILGRYRQVDKMLPWRTQFASAGFVPSPFSNFAETQADCLLKRVQVRGFHVEKCQSSLLLFWQHRELVSVSAWKC